MRTENSEYEQLISVTLLNNYSLHTHNFGVGTGVPSSHFLLRYMRFNWSLSTLYYGWRYTTDIVPKQHEILGNDRPLHGCCLATDGRLAIGHP